MTHVPARRWAPVAAAALLAGVLSPLATPPASAAVTFATPAPAAVSAAPDYATEAWHDPWDYDNPEDQRLDLKAGMLNVSNARLERSRLLFTTGAGATFDPILTWPNDIGWGRDGALRPIDASRYKRISFAMRSSARVSGGIFWFNCASRVASCQGGMPFQIEAGWHVYDLVLAKGFPSTTVAWSGMLTGLRILPGNDANNNVEVDWIRLYQVDESARVDWTDSNPGNPVQLYYDTDGQMANNTPDNPGWGLFTTVTSQAQNSTLFNASAYPPGVYRFYAVDNGVTSGYSAPLTIDGAPRPVIEQPDAAGGADYASVVRGDGWDFGQATDTVGVRNATNVSFANGVLSATNSGPNQNDPQVSLPLGPVPIDGSRFHRLSFTYSYDGPFGLEDAPGGGALARIIWQVAGGGPNDYQDLNDLVTYQGQNRVVVDLASNPPTAVLDEDQVGARLGWAGRQITSLRFDPNEDPGARRWHLDDIRIAEDDRASEAFNVVFRDDAWEAGTTADIFIDTNNSGADGTQIAQGLSVVSGSNTFRWQPAATPAGTYWVYVTLRDSRNSATTYSSGPVKISPVERIAGADRISTAIAAADAAFAPDTAGAVVLARHDNFPDALAGTPLAGAKDAPLLLTPPSGLDGRVETAVRRLLPAGRTVYLLGGEGALSASVADRVRAMGYAVVRFSGADRYETAARIAEGIGTVGDVFLTTGTNFPDALGAGAAAAKVKGALVLTNGTTVPPATSAYLAGRPGVRRWAVGAPAAQADPTATAISGANRYDTSALVAERFFTNPRTAGVASGANFPDALAGGSHAAKLGGPLVLSPPEGLTTRVRDYLAANRASIVTAYLYGGPAALSDNVLQGVESAVG
ncbi:MAG TPA: cell wall-binding repeat-containing protein [Acidimicrobiales bacterium]|nr:cell wall-binding repeat-containing protein [Acidimicrobiales bacterium]